MHQRTPPTPTPAPQAKVRRTGEYVQQDVVMEEEETESEDVAHVGSYAPLPASLAIEVPVTPSIHIWRR